jgi:hypothetical protein
MTKDFQISCHQLNSPFLSFWHTFWYWDAVNGQSVIKVFLVRNAKSGFVPTFHYMVVAMMLNISIFINFGWVKLFQSTFRRGVTISTDSVVQGLGTLFTRCHCGDTPPYTTRGNLHVNRTTQLIIKIFRDHFGLDNASQSVLFSA